MKTLVSVFILTLLVGCATPSKEAKGEFAGYYVMIKGGFNESMTVELAPDGTYVLDHELFMCVIGPNGELPINYAREVGTWRFADGMVLLEPKSRTRDFPDASVFVPSLAHRLLPKRDGFTRLLVSAGYPDHFVMKKARKPMQSPQTTSGGFAPLRV